MVEKIKHDWKKLVAESKGQMIFLPEMFLEKAKVWIASREELNKKTAEVAKLSVETDNIFQNLMLEVRHHLFKAGQTDIFMMDTGFETNGLKDGEFIFTVTEGRS